MAYFKDEFGRDFLTLSNLSVILNLSKKQTLKHVRDRNMLSKKHGRVRYILKDDIIQSYPNLAVAIGEIREQEDSSSEENFHFDSRVGNIGEVSLYKADEKQDLILTKIDRLGSIISEFEKRTTNIRQIERDVAANQRILGRLDHRSDKRGVGFYAILIVGFLLISGAISFGVYKFKGLYDGVLVKHEEQLVIRDAQITSLVDQYKDLSIQYTNKTALYEQALHKINDRFDEIQAQAVPPTEDESILTIQDHE